MSKIAKISNQKKIFLVSGIFLSFLVLNQSDASAQKFDEYSVEVITVQENLRVPWAIDFAPDGRIFFTERGGDLRVIEDGVLREEPVRSFDVGRVEGGMLGVALDPNFKQNHHVYLYYTYSELLSTYNRVVRFTESDNTLTGEKILVDKIPGGIVHDGGRIKFGPDGKLYITTGDSGNAQLSQNLDSLAGKILRINPDGTIPQDNPFEGSPVYSYGHRNPQGLDWHPVSGKLVATEHGPSGERGFAHDEINVIEPGKNYGWPEVVGDENAPKFVDPILHTGDITWAPSGATFYDSQNIEEWYGKYFVATLRGVHLRIIEFDLEQNEIVSSEALFENEFGRLRAATVGPDGDLYILTSNQDGRGNPAPNDDRILKIVQITEKEKMPDGMKPPMQQEKESLIGDPERPPKVQTRQGVEPRDVACKESFELILKTTDGSPACVSHATLAKLVERGWGTKP